MHTFSLASIIDPAVMFSPGVMLLFVGLAWLTRLTEKLHPHETETLHIASDPETIFTKNHAPEDADHRKPAAVVPQPHHPDWVMADTIYHDLANSNWIADEMSLTLTEAIKGGKYTFERTFMLPDHIEDVVSAELLMLVDNWCTPTVNGRLLERKGGKIDLLEWDLSTTLQSGENHIAFVVENNPAVEALADDPRWTEWNPYGLKYLIRIQHPK